MKTLPGQIQNTQMIGMTLIILGRTEFLQTNWTIV